jgi:hypothetical protein
VNAAANSASLTIDSESNEITTNIPSASGRETGLFSASVIKTTGTTAATFDIDYIISRYTVTR